MVTAHRARSLSPVSSAGSSSLLSNGIEKWSGSSSHHTKKTLRLMHEQASDQRLAEQLAPLADDLQIGVDRVRFHFPLDPARTDGISIGPFLPRRGRNVELPLELGGVPARVHLAITSRGGALGQADYWATVEFNPAVFMRNMKGQDGGLCPWSYVKIICELTLYGVEHIAAPLVAYDDIEVVALHLARDFAVDDAGAWVTASVGTRPAWSRGQAVYFSADRQPQTMRTGSKTCRVLLYDKHAETPGAWASAHPLRWEDQVTGNKALTRLGLGTLADLTPSALALATAKLWRQSRLGGVRKPRSLTRLVAASGASSAEQRDLLGWVVARADGVRLEADMSSPMLRDYRRRAETLGIRVHRRLASGVTIVADPSELNLIRGRETSGDGLS